MRNESEKSESSGAEGRAEGEGSPVAGSFKSQRLQSLDAYRGLIMISLAFGGFGLAKTAGRFLDADPDSGFWRAVQYQFSHVQWVGCA